MTDMIEAVARALSKAEHGDEGEWQIYVAEAQAAITAHTAALIDGAGENKPSDYVLGLVADTIEYIDHPCEYYYADEIVKLVATIAALRAELVRVKRALRSIAWPMNEAGPWAQAVAAAALPSDTVADSDGDDGA